MFGLLTKFFSVKMAGYWPSSFFYLTEQAWSLKDLSYGFGRNFFLRDTAGSPERARSILRPRLAEFAI